ncbi:CP family cyanate transporter-like MFS transporter [Thalassobacillus pellis]|nr:CP family cyanate transporter-like MFS transporter [Thalassobacillus pellis]
MHTQKHTPAYIQKSRYSGDRKLLIIGIILIAFNLRPAITAVGPLISTIREDLGISNGMAGMLTTLPLLAFAVLSALAPRLGLRLGNGMAIQAGVAILAFGILVRSFESITTIFTGTALIGIGIAILNVLLPGVVKQAFPLKVGVMTGLYSISMSLFASIGSGVSVPFANTLDSGWQGSLLVWSLLAVLAFIAWLPQKDLQKSVHKVPKMDPANNPLWRSKLAWQVTFFMGLQSFLFYSLIAWLPEILQSRGMDPAASGWMLSWLQIIGLPATFLIPVLAGRLKSQRGIIMGIGIVYLTGMFGMLLGSAMLLLTISISLVGIAQGSCISLALTLLGLRAPNAAQAANLSGMAQSFGYLLAASGPIAIGYLYDYVHSWTPSIVILLAVVCLMLIAGIGAGKDAYVPDNPQAEA